MKIDNIRNQIAEKLCNDSEIWKRVLNNTQPDNYACDHWNVEVTPTDIGVDIHNKAFSVHEGFFTSDIRFNSRIDGTDRSYNKAFTAKGKFELEPEGRIRFEEIDIAIEIDIF